MRIGALSRVQFQYLGSRRWTKKMAYIDEQFPARICFVDNRNHMKYDNRNHTTILFMHVLHDWTYNTVEDRIPTSTFNDNL